MRDNPYESKRYLNEYLLFHYGTAQSLCPFAFVPRELLRFHERLTEECLLPLQRKRLSAKPKASNSGPTLGLDIGCAVGRFTFELGRVVDRVLGLDNSHQFIRAANQMARQHAMRVAAPESGAQFATPTLSLPKALRRCEVEFRVGDALNLKGLPDHAFHVVAAINLIDRLPRPREFLGQLPRLVATAGRLIIASPFTWLSEYTPHRGWLTNSQMLDLLKPHFQPVRRLDLPFVIREHRRKYQLVVSEVFSFVRR